MLNTINTKLLNNQLVEIMQACEKIIFSGKKKIISHKKDGSSVTNIDIEVDNYIYKEFVPDLIVAQDTKVLLDMVKDNVEIPVVAPLLKYNWARNSGQKNLRKFLAVILED